MADLRYDGRVAVITGAGAGLGRSYALLFAARGAKVVVNDLGGGRHGAGSSSQAADAVVEEIQRNGGTAVADYNSVVEGDKIIKTALDHFGRIDILVNNAGILRDKSFARMSDQDWDLVHAVHLKGSFKTSQAAFPIFKKQGYGRIVMTSSSSGLYGNFGQANYSAAKMGVVGLSNTIAIEGGKSNIHCNAIVPIAASRLTEDILPPDLLNELKPELIAPVVAYLCHESCEENGSVIESAAGWAGKCHIVRANGSLLRRRLTDGVTLENVNEAWRNVTDMTNAKPVDKTQPLDLKGLRTDDGSIENKNSHGEEEDIFEYTEKDLILYALGVGASLVRPHELKYLYECHENFTSIPTYFCQVALQTLTNLAVIEQSIPGKIISMAHVLHGEQYIEFLGELPTEGKLRSKCNVVEVLDKGSGAAVIVNVDTLTESGTLVLRQQIVVFVVGAGNFGGQRTGTKMIPCQAKPQRAPDVSVSQRTSIDQAALYRLSGDRNPLHIDPNMAALSGFKEPILHGLSGLGLSVRLIMNSYAGGDTKLFKACKVRFMKPVIPGDTLTVNMWRDGNRIHFETIVAERNVVALGGAYVDLKQITIMSPSAASPSDDGVQLQSDAIFEYIIDQVKADPAKAKSINGIFLYNITKNGKQVRQWTMDLKSGKVYKGQPNGKPNTTLTISDEDFIDLAQGKLQAQSAFMKGKLKITGNIMLAQKLAPLLKANAKL